MLLQINGISFNILIDKANLATDKKPVVFLHGFTGSAEEWKFIFNKLPTGFFPVAIDLIGHGQSNCPVETEPYSTEKQITNLKNIFDELNLDNLVLVGYSMGGRLALSFALNFPGYAKALVLESSSPGISGTELRIERSKQDNELAKRILHEGLDEFLEYWINIPLFNSQQNLSPSIKSKIKEFKKANNPWGLANSLISFGTGVMPDLWPKINNLNIKTLLITGELDLKFSDINTRVSQLIPESEHKIVPFCGHNTHLEKPEEFTILVNRFIEKL